MNALHLPIALCAMFLAVWGRSAWASGASGHVNAVKQPDGSVIRVRNSGGEWFHWHETEDGYVVDKASDGYWKHCRPKAGSADFEIVEDAIVGRVSAPARGFKPKELPSRKDIQDHIQRVRGEQPAKPARKLQPSGQGASGPGSASAANADGGSGDTGGGGSAAGLSMDTRTVHCIVILASFSDHWDSANNTVLTTKGRPSAEYDALFNQVGYNLDNSAGSVRDFYLQNSYGKLTIVSHIVGWVQLPQTESYYGNNTNEVNGAGRCRTMVSDAIAAADAAGFDFSVGDGDGDGFVDLIHVIHSGFSEAYGGNPTTSMWPRHWWLSGGRIIVDGVGINDFSFSCALRGLYTSTPALCRVGEICHELGHQFGLPDLYDVGGVTQGIGTWCCMGVGNWGAVSGSTYDARKPVQFSAHCKQMLGFVQPRVLHSEGTVSIQAVENAPEVHLVRDGSPSESEYFLIENRQPVGFDSLLPPGLLIWHIKNDAWKNDTTAYLNPAVRLEEANGGDLLSTNRYASTNQTWKSATGLSGGFRDQTGDSDSNAMVYQSGSQYNRSDSTASYTRIRLNNFSASGSTMTYSVQTVVPRVASQSLAAKGYTVAWNAASDATSYDLQEGTPTTETSFTDSAEDVDAFYENWLTTGLARRSTASAKTGGACYMMASKNETNTLFLSHPQSMQLRTSFKITSSTVLSAWVMSHISTGRGNLRIELSKDNGVTWNRLDSISGFLDPWTQKTYGIAALNAAGIQSGDTCLLRFIGHIQDIWGWSGFPNYGFALDDISLTGVEIAGQTNWTTVATGLTSTNYAFTSKPIGSLAYRARAIVAGSSQAWSPAALVQRLATPFETWALSLPPMLQAETADADGDGVQNILEYALGRQGATATGADGAQQLPSAGISSATGSDRMTLSVNLPEPCPGDVTYAIQVSNTLSGGWTTIATKIGTGAWTGSAAVSSNALGGGRVLHVISDIINVASAPNGARFMRLAVTY